MDDSALLPVYGARDLIIDHGEGCFLYDSNGRRYLDCVGGVAVNALGHAHPAVVSAIEKQARRFIHASNLYVLPTQVELSTRLRTATGFPKVFFSNSGTEANEGAIKFARRHAEVQAHGHAPRRRIITFTQSFHGRTYASMTATGQDRIRQGFGPLLEGFTTVPFGDAEALRKAIGAQAESGGSDVAAILFEPILAEGGILTHPPEVVAVLRAAQEQGILLIADEIQTGLGRTGTFLACAWLGVRPDIVTLAKPLGGGLPLGAILVSDAVAMSLKQGDHGSTFGGNPVACAAGCAVVDVILHHGFLDDMMRRSDILVARLRDVLASKRAAGVPVGEVRGKGFLLGFSYGDPSGADVAPLQLAMREQGVLVYRAGANVVRLLPPLIISEPEINQLLAAFEVVLGSLPARS
jgi:acetylornithine/N-succinyldiaminopimelate aminotransferase